MITAKQSRDWHSTAQEKGSSKAVVMLAFVRLPDTFHQRCMQTQYTWYTTMFNQG